ncbi:MULTISPECIES: hypothetical protein [Tenacibaculum]|nr:MULTISPECIES: hypothetical protein [Tenacibaculum]MCT4699548.1 hypothetical protein [Tenacibaculum haliotis]WBX70552.1 hypothetical protein PG912_09800 [Tenacibaculum retecalamus]
MREKLLKKNNLYYKLNSKVGRILTQEQLIETTSKTSNKTRELVN